MKAKSPAILLALTLTWSVAFAEASAVASEATAHVSVEVMPHIAISGPAAVTIGLRDCPAGARIPAQIQFLVRANTPEVDLYVACTDLYKAGDPKSAYRIPVAGPGVQVTCTHGSQAAGGTGLLPWRHTSLSGTPFPDWTGAASEVGTFTAAPTDVFSQNVTVDVAWQATNTELPPGEYTGFVQLIGMVHP